MKPVMQLKKAVTRTERIKHHEDAGTLHEYEIEYYTAFLSLHVCTPDIATLGTHYPMLSACTPLCKTLVDKVPSPALPQIQ
jgi:hypothetical protein